MSKHTPGPWKAYRKADYTIPGWVILWPDSSKPGVHYRRLDYNGGFIEEDARLIAAAPDLLAALEMVLDDPQALDGRPRTYEFVRAAIAKAKGQS